jgi:hypothetical protein
MKAVIPDKKNAEGGGESSDYGVADLVRAQRGEIFFIQLPDHLPVPVPHKPPADTANPVPAPADNCSLARLQVG